jgi:hypothetical protein
MAMLYYQSRSLPVKKTPNKHDPAPKVEKNHLQLPDWLAHLWLQLITP